MPEGDTIYRAATRVRSVLTGHTIVATTGSWKVMDADSLVNTSVSRVVSRGKHLLIHLDNGRVLHSHMGMTGSWHVYPAGERWKKPQTSAALSLHTANHQVVCFSPKQIELMSERQLARNPWMKRLGPDLISESPADKTVITRFRTQNSVAIGEAVMNQSVVSGIGNIYKSEVLFLEQTHPQTLVRDLSDTEILSIVRTAAHLLKANSLSVRRRTRRRATGSRLWVYNRGGQPCQKCGGTIQLIRQGSLGRTTYFCSACQSRTDMGTSQSDPTDQ